MDPDYLGQKTRAFTLKQSGPRVLATSQSHDRFTGLRFFKSRKRASGFTRFQLRGRVSAFTLIELLVVITIIVILMGLLFPVFRGAQDQAKKVQAKNDLTQIVTAVNACYTEYGKYPVKQTDAGDSQYDTDNDQLFNVLRGYSSSGYQLGLNPRQIQFTQIPVAKDQSAPRGGLGGGVWYDPWGSPYRIKMDGDYDGKVANPYSMNAGYNPIEAGCVAWSLGRDQKGGTGDKKSADSEDDVISWQ